MNYNPGCEFCVRTRGKADPHRRADQGDEAAEENISGADVPNATMVSPIIRGETPQFLASAEAPKTNLSAPQIRPINPRTMMKVSRSISRRILSDFEEAGN